MSLTLICTSAQSQATFTALEARSLNAQLAQCDGYAAKIVTLQEAMAKAEKAIAEAKEKMKKQDESISTYRKVLTNTNNAYKEQKKATETCEEQAAKDVKKEKRKGNAKGWGFGVGCGAVGAGIGLLVGIFAIK